MQVSEIDWENWSVDEVATLLFVVRDDEVLLIHKKRGLGAGNINGPGGRLEPGETPIECAIRETREELCIDVGEVRPAGELFFHSDAFPKIHGHVFTAASYRGTPTETDEAIPLWFPISSIPFDRMWDDDRYWLPQVLAGKTVTGWFTFDGERLSDRRVMVDQTVDG
jgi:8-oxo-dGTP diphosphatase